MLCYDYFKVVLNADLKWLRFIWSSYVVHFQFLRYLLMEMEMLRETILLWLY